MVLPFEGSPGADAAFDAVHDYTEVALPLRIVDHLEPGPCTVISLDDSTPKPKVPPCTAIALSETIPDSPYEIPQDFQNDTASGIPAPTAFRGPDGMLRADNIVHAPVSPVDGLKSGHPYDTENGRFKN